MSIITILNKYTSDALEHYADLQLNPVEIDNEGNREAVELSPGEKQERLNTVAKWLSYIPGEMMRTSYEDLLFKTHKSVILKKSNLTKAVAAKVEAANTAKSREVIQDGDKLKAKLPEGIDVYEVLRDGGWYQIEDGIDGTGIYFLEGVESEPKRVSNFTIEAVFMKKERENPTRIVKICDGFLNPTYVELSTTAFLSRESFRKFIGDTGPYWYYGSANQLDRVAQKIWRKFPEAWELTELGFQPEGFFAFYNYAFNGVLKKYSDAGLVEHDGRHFYSPAVSKVYDGLRKSNDDFKNDRYLSYAPPAISYSDWAQLIKETYKDHSISIIYSTILALHRDIHFKIDNNCPHIYFYGDTGSGKSKAGESIMAMFFHGLPAFALSSGTPHAMALRFGRYRNCPVAFNELDKQYVDGDRVNMLKTAFDGEGKESGTKQRGKSITYTVESLIIMMGQFLFSEDDMSLVNRSILEKFTKKKRGKKQTEAYQKLKKLEEKGLGGVITELMPYRGEMEEKYYEAFHVTMRSIHDELLANEVDVQERVLRNYSAFATFAKLFEPYFDLPHTAAEVRTWAIARITDMCELLGKNDILTSFWSVLEMLKSEGIIRHGKHFKTEAKAIVRVTVNGKDVNQNIAEGESTAPREVMWIRLGLVHQLYLKACRSSGDKPIDKASLYSYIKEKPYYIGSVDSEKFTEMVTKTESGNTKKKNVRTSAFLIDMEKANLLNTGFMDAGTEWENPMEAAAAEEEKKDKEADDDSPF